MRLLKLPLRFATKTTAGAHSRRERELTRQREEQEAAKPRRALRWAQQAGLQGADSHQQSIGQRCSGSETGIPVSEMPATASQEAAIAGKRRSLFFNKGKKQMDENQFWTNVWRAVAIAVVSIVAVMAGCTAHNTAAIKDMVTNGANPIDAMCSINGTSTTPQCIVRALGK